jgi:hypothetical protein
LASDQVVAGSNPAAPIRFSNGSHSQDGGTSFINEPSCARLISFDYRTGVPAVQRFAKFIG